MNLQVAEGIKANTLPTIMVTNHVVVVVPVSKTGLVGTCVGHTKSPMQSFTYEDSFAREAAEWEVRDAAEKLVCHRDDSRKLPLAYLGDRARWLSGDTCYYFVFAIVADTEKVRLRDSSGYCWQDPTKLLSVARKKQSEEGEIVPKALGLLAENAGELDLQFNTCIVEQGLYKRISKTLPVLE